MQIKPLKPEQISFDPVEGTFDALVTLCEQGTHFRYPCSFKAPLAMPLAIAALRLSQQAKSRHAQGKDLRSVASPPATGILAAKQKTLPRVA